MGTDRAALATRLLDEARKVASIGFEHDLRDAAALLRATCHTCGWWEKGNAFACGRGVSVPYGRPVQMNMRPKQGFFCSLWEAREETPDEA